MHLQKAQNEIDLHHRETNVVPRKAQMLQIRRLQVSPNIAHASALKIQRAFRGYLVSFGLRSIICLVFLKVDQSHAQTYTITVFSGQWSYVTVFLSMQARRNYQALKGLIRLQAMMRGHDIKRQIMEAMKCMRLLVKVQTQIHARRVEMMESRASQPHHTSESDGIFGRWTTLVRVIKKNKLPNTC